MEKFSAAAAAGALVKLSSPGKEERLFLLFRGFGFGFELAI